MLSTSHFAIALRLFGLTGVLAIAACSDDATGPTPNPARPLGSAVAGSPGDTTRGSTTGEWHLATIRGIALGLDKINSGAGGDTTRFGTTALAGAKVEIRKVRLIPTADFRPWDYQDLAVVATVTADAEGKFEYVLSEPIVVKSGEPSPMISYRVTITPLAGSPYAVGDLQVTFAEQFQAGTTAWNYLLFRR